MSNADPHRPALDDISLVIDAAGALSVRLSAIEAEIAEARIKCQELMDLLHDAQRDRRGHPTEA